MLSERRRIVLSALVEEYVQSAQPVASRRLVDRYKVGWSSATVRNDLAHLEETGYVYQPHVSAGRIPTDVGYRAFVDDIDFHAASLGLAPAEIEVVRNAYAALELRVSELMHETSAILSKLTNYVAVVLAPVVEPSRIRRIDLVHLSDRRALLVVITESGRVMNRQVELPSEASEQQFKDAEALLNRAFDRKPAEEVRRLGAPDDPAGKTPRDVLETVVREIAECLGEADTEQLYRAGTATLLSEPEFADSRTVQPLVELLEDGFTTLQVLSEVLEKKEVVVRIGSENAAAGLEHVSFVARNYGGDGGEGIVALIGPTRMDYPRAIGAVRLVADSLSEALSQ